MRDEGPFLLEWLAYHRQLGFGEIFIASNDCTDGSDDLLATLAQAGALTHLPHQPPKGISAQESGIAAAFAGFAETPPDWLLHIDADEFLWLDAGETLQSLIARAGAAHVIALPWAGFGDSGHGRWPGATLPHFTRRGSWPDPVHDKFKSFFRPAAFASAHDHMPTRPKVAAPQVVSASGAALDPAPLLSRRHHARYRPFELSLKPGPARINHYAIRSSDTFAARARRGDGQGKVTGKYRLGSRWHRIANRNEIEDTTMLAHWPATCAELTRLRALPGVLARETACLAHHFPMETRHDA